MKLKKLFIKDFLSYQTAEIDFDKVGPITLIIGRHGNDYKSSNGVGKTTILEAVVFALYERSRLTENKNATLDQLVCNFSKDGEMVCQLEFELNKQLYKITRKRNKITKKGGCTLEVQEGKEWRSLTEDKKTKTNQEIVKLIKIDYDTFLASVLLPQREIDSFVKASGQERKQIVADILQLDRYDNYKASAKARLDDFTKELQSVESYLSQNSVNQLDVELKEKELKECESKIHIYKLEVEQYQESLENLRAQQVQYNREIERKVNLRQQQTKLEATVKDLEKKIKESIERQDKYFELYEEKKEQFLKTQQEFDILENKFEYSKEELISQGKDCTKTMEEKKATLTNSQSNYSEAKGKLQHIDKEIDKVKNLESNVRCPTCLSKITEQSKTEATQELESTKSNLAIRLESLEHKVQSDQEYYQVAKKEVERVKELITEYNQWVKDKNHLKEKLADLKESGIHAKQILQDQKSILTENQSLIDFNKEELEKTKKEFDQIKIDEDKFNQLNEKIASYNKKSEQSSILLSQNTLNKGRIQVEIELFNKKVQASKDLQEKREKLLKEKFYYGSLVSLYGKEIPSLIIENNRNEIEQMANEILQLISDMTIKLQTQRQTLKGEARESFDIEVLATEWPEARLIDNLSEGQKFRVVLSIRIALSKLLSRRAACSIDFLFYDECFASLDQSGIEQVIEIFKILEKEFRHQLIITHREDLKELFDSHICIEMKDSISRIVEE